MTEAPGLSAIRTNCRRFFVAPLEMCADSPVGDIVCRLCEGN